jgi:hypothetical protein
MVGLAGPKGPPGLRSLGGRAGLRWIVCVRSDMHRRRPVPPMGPPLGERGLSRRSSRSFTFEIKITTHRVGLGCPDWCRLTRRAGLGRDGSVYE